EDNRQLIHYFRRTACGRFTMGGGKVSNPKGKEMATMDTSKTWEALEAHTKWMFPQLKNIKFEYRWGGPVSVNLDMAPEIGFIGDERVIYANGCIGHGVAITQLNGRTIADLVLEKKTELSSIWFVNRKAVPWPPGLLGDAAYYAITGALALWDRIDERKLVK
ncbi:MAG: FAD-binding oxidoreductase, partial [Rhizobiaceae bacterium]